MGLVDRVFHPSHPKFHEQNLSYIVNSPRQFLSYPFHTKNYFSQIKIPHLQYKSVLVSHPCPSPYFFVIPFIKGIPRKLYTRIQDNGNKLVFSVNNKLNSLIKLHEDPLLKLNHSNIIYKIDCDAS